MKKEVETFYEDEERTIQAFQSTVLIGGFNAKVRRKETEEETLLWETTMWAKKMKEERDY